MRPPSLYLRERTLFSETSDSLAQHRGPTPKPTFDYVQWRRKTGSDKHFGTDSPFSSTNTLVAMDEQDHDSADFDRAVYCKLFGREGSPLTELSEESDTVEARNKPVVPRRVLERGQMRPLKSFRAGTQPSTPHRSQRLALRRVSEPRFRTRHRAKQAGASRPE
ncbi:hypothetical protein ACEPAH_7763 [Sanghuangporus vaninii]